MLHVNYPDVPAAQLLFILATKQVRALLYAHTNNIDDHLPLDVVPNNVHWLDIIRFYNSLPTNSPLPLNLVQLINTIHHVQLPRNPITIHLPLRLNPNKGMSPKKAHEVTRMAAYIASLLTANTTDPAAVRIVDVGAGQGYLTRALKHLLPSTPLLALDADPEQIRGAQRWEHRDRTAPIAHRNILITPENLLDTLDDWLGSEESNSAHQNRPQVLFVALHACGSLTPDVLRAFLAARRSPRPGWSPFGVVAVGCCYNLMDPSDFPLSNYLRTKPSLDLPPSAFQLAAQIPSQWLEPLVIPSRDRKKDFQSTLHAPQNSHSQDTTMVPLAHALPSVELAVRKVAWRALLGRLKYVPSTSPPVPARGTGAHVPARWARMGSGPVPSPPSDLMSPCSIPAVHACISASPPQTLSDSPVVLVPASCSESTSASCSSPTSVPADDISFPTLLSSPPSLSTSSLFSSSPSPSPSIAPSSEAIAPLSPPSSIVVSSTTPPLTSLAVLPKALPVSNELFPASQLSITLPPPPSITTLSTPSITTLSTPSIALLPPLPCPAADPFVNDRGTVDRFHSSDRASLALNLDLTAMCLDAAATNTDSATASSDSVTSSSRNCTTSSPDSIISCSSSSAMSTDSIISRSNSSILSSDSLMSCSDSPSAPIHLDNDMNLREAAERRRQNVQSQVDLTLHSITLDCTQCSDTHQADNDNFHGQMSIPPSQNTITEQPVVSISQNMSKPFPQIVVPTTNATLRTFTLVKEPDAPLLFGSSSPPAPFSRLGRLRDAAYQDWPTFVQAAETRLGVKFVNAVAFADLDAAPEASLNVGRVPHSSNKGIPPTLLASLPTIENLHVLRCLLGPAVESLLLLDRLVWVLEALESEGDDHRTDHPDPELKKGRWEYEPHFDFAGKEGGEGMHRMGLRIRRSPAGVSSALVNLFDQAIGSGRNVALVVADILP